MFSFGVFKEQPVLEKLHEELDLNVLVAGRVPGRRLGKGVGPEWEK